MSSYISYVYVLRRTKEVNRKSLHKHACTFIYKLHSFMTELYLRALLRVEVKGISHNPLLSSLYASLNKLIIDALLYIRARACTTALALVEEQGKMGLLHCFLHCKRKYNFIKMIKRVMT